MAARATANPNLNKIPSPAEKAGPPEEEIRQRAHEIYLERGCRDGSELDDWLEAEAEIRQLQQEQA